MTSDEDSRHSMACTSRTVTNHRSRIIDEFRTENGVVYKKGDCVYVDSNRSDQPYYVCSIIDFRLGRRETVLVHVKYYYRQTDVPDAVVDLLLKDRHSENKSGHELIIRNPVIRVRELFISDCTDSYSADLLRGKCSVLHYQDIESAQDFEPGLDKFFYILGYNPETKRLATTQGEIRVGASHQAKLPPLRERTPDPGGLSEGDNGSSSISTTSWEECLWRPSQIADSDLIMFLRAARSVAAAFSGLDGAEKEVEDRCAAASMDDTTINAYHALHSKNYDTAAALQHIVKTPIPKMFAKKWSEDATKRFMKGLKQFGKNFYKIRKELLPNKQTSELVEYYYFWKKTPVAIGNRPHRRHRRPGIPRSNKTNRNNRPASSEFLDLSSAGESDLDSDDSERDFSQYACRHCFSTDSRNWHHAGKEGKLLCTKCRDYYKKYGEDRPLPNKPSEPPFSL